MNKIYLGKHDYKLKDCIFATTCKRYFGKKCDKICDEFAAKYANKYDDDDLFLFYLNNIEKLAQYYDIEYSGKLFLHNHNSNSVFGFQLYDE